MPLAEGLSERRAGRLAGHVGDAFFEPLPDEELDAWEIAPKQHIGKLDGVPDAAARYAELIAADGFQHLLVHHLHALRAGTWDVQHRDLFERMLAAQSELERMPLLTRDPAVALFGVETLW